MRRLRIWLGYPWVIQEKGGNLGTSWNVSPRFRSAALRRRLGGDVHLMTTLSKLIRLTFLIIFGIIPAYTVFFYILKLSRALKDAVSNGLYGRGAG